MKMHALVSTVLVAFAGTALAQTTPPPAPAKGTVKADREAVKMDKAAVKGLDIARSGIYLIEPFGPLVAGSDYSNFRKVGVPFVFRALETVPFEQAREPLRIVEVHVATVRFEEVPTRHCGGGCRVSRG